MDWWCDRAWIYVSCVLSAAMFCWMLVCWNEWSTALKVLASIAVLIPVHVVEEWVFPGGFHYQYNIGLYKSDAPDRYPMCRLTDMITNLGATLMYIGFVIYCVCNSGEVPNGLILGTVGFCALEMILHTFFGIKMYFRFRSAGKKTIYGPGSITAYWCFVPLGVIGWHCIADSIFTSTDWWVAGGVLAAIGCVWILGAELLFRRRDTAYYFLTAGYYERFLNK